MLKTCIYYITFRCNDTCEFCHIWDDNKLQKIGEAPFDAHIKNLNNARRKEAILLDVTGGEPLLYDNLPRFLEGAKRLDFQTSLTTNGILYKDRAKELKGLIDNLFFSLDYPTREEHDRSRGVECFSTALSSIQYAKDIGENPHIKFIITRDSVRFLPEMVELAEKLNVKVYIRPIYDFHGLHGFESSTYDHIKYYFKRKNVVINLAEFEFLKNCVNKDAWIRSRTSKTTITFLPDGTQTSLCCTRTPYMLPSFKLGFDRYRFLDWYSDWINNRKPA